MSGSANTPSALFITDNIASFQIAGTNTAADGEKAIGIVAIDPNTGKPIEPGTRTDQWCAFNNPATNTQATAAQAAVAGKTHVITGVSARLTSNSALAATAAATLTVYDGTSAGTVLFQTQLTLPNTPGSRDELVLSGLNIPCTAGNAATIQFAAAGGVGTFEQVALFGYDR